MSERARRYYKREYLKRIGKLRKQSDIPLAILVWGPGEHGGVLYKKRVDILNLLRENGHTAMFSEEESKRMRDLDTAEGKALSSTKGYEFLQALASDAIVLLRCSRGSEGEFQDFSPFKSIASSMVVFADEEDRLGYTDLGALTEFEKLFSKVHRYKFPDDIDSCKLKGEVLSLVRHLQNAKFRAKQLKEQWW